MIIDQLPREWYANVLRLLAGNGGVFSSLKEFLKDIAGQIPPSQEYRRQYLLAEVREQADVTMSLAQEPALLGGLEVTAILDRMAGRQRPLDAAATAWFRFERNKIDNPGVGEWCLWSIVTEHGREYYSGSRLLSGRIHLDGLGISVPLDDQVWWARVRSMPQGLRP